MKNGICWSPLRHVVCARPCSEITQALPQDRNVLNHFVIELAEAEQIVAVVVIVGSDAVEAAAPRVA